MSNNRRKTIEPETIKELLDWSYANLAAYSMALQQDPPQYTQECFMIRARLYKGLRTGNMSRSSIYKNERFKLTQKDQCAYCGETDVELTLDHLFPRYRNGDDSGNNLVYCCKRCNSSKGKKDYFAWVAETGRRIRPEIAERYLKNAYSFCERHGLLDLSIEDITGELKQSMPFDLDEIPLKYRL